MLLRWEGRNTLHDLWSEHWQSSFPGLSCHWNMYQSWLRPFSDFSDPKQLCRSSHTASLEALSQCCSSFSSTFPSLVDRYWYRKNYIQVYKLSYASLNES